MLNLPDVTLVCYEVKVHELAAAALRAVLREVKFAAVHVWSDRELGVPVTRHFEADPDAPGEYVSRFLWHHQHEGVESSHLLTFQWDSGVINQSLWRDEFLNYDYVGAPWPWRAIHENVGCGGFTLRSTRLCQFLVDHEDEFPVEVPEDDVLCRKHRPALEKLGFKWAPPALAETFAIERFERPRPAFGFHGAYNLPRFLPRPEFISRIALANDYVRMKPDWVEMLRVAASMR